jgi:hypothetical protein
VGPGEGNERTTSGVAPVYATVVQISAPSSNTVAFSTRVNAPCTTILRPLRYECVPCLNPARSRTIENCVVAPKNHASDF